MKIAGIVLLILATIVSIRIAQAQSPNASLAPKIQAEALNNQGVNRSDDGKRTEAIELLTEAISLRPDYAIAYGNLGPRPAAFAEYGKCHG